MYGQDCLLITDKNPTTYILTRAQLDVTGHCWLASLASYNFTVKYRPEKTNTDAEVSEDCVHAICNMVHVSNHIESACASADVVDVDDETVRLRYNQMSFIDIENMFIL